MQEIEYLTISEIIERYDLSEEQIKRLKEIANAPVKNKKDIVNGISGPLKKPKYKTVYPEKYNVELDFPYHCVLWIKDKKTKEKLMWKHPQEYPIDVLDPFKSAVRFFLLQAGKLYLSSTPDNNCPKRLLIKYV